jgi:PAS domain S-box-containing protein
MTMRPATNTAPAREGARVVAVTSGDRFLDRVPRIAGWMAVAIGVLGLIGYLTGAYELGSWIPGTSTIRANSAVVVALLGGAILLLDVAPRRGMRVRRAAAALAAASIAIAAVTLFEWATGTDFGIDRLLFAPAPDDLASSAPGRMSPPAAGCYLLIGVALLCRWHGRLRGVGDVAAGTALVTASVVVAGQLYGAASLASAGGNITAVPAGIALLALSLGLVTHNRDGVLVRWVSDPGIAGHVVRRVVPIIPMIAVIAWVALRVHQAGLLPEEYLASAGVVLVAFTLVIVGGSTADLVGSLARDGDEARALNTMVLESIREGVVTADAQGLITSWSDGAASIFGYTADEMIGRTPDVLYQPDTDGGPRLGRAFDGEWRGRRKDGALVDVRIRTRPMFAPDGTVIGGFAIVHDASEALRDQRRLQQLAAAVEQSAESVVMTDLEGRMTYVNPAFERLTGYRRDEVIGANPRMLKSGKQSPSFYRAMWATLSSGLPWVAEMTNRRKDGSLYLEEAVFTPIRDAGGTITSYVAVKRDVTRERTLESAAASAARERAMIGETLMRLPAGMTTEMTADAICQQVASLSDVTHAHLLIFDASGIAESVGLAANAPVELVHRQLPARRSRELLARCAEGPWIEQWRPSPAHPYAGLATALGVRAAAYVPIRADEEVVGLLAVGSSRTDHLTSLPEVLPSLAEFGDLAGVLLTPTLNRRAAAVEDRRELRAVIDDAAFTTVFQPIVDLRTRRPVGYEALTRFTDGTRPDLMFARAARMALGADLERATIRCAISASAELPPDGGFMSVNVSPTLVLAEDAVLAHLRGMERPVVLEVTEHDEIADYAALCARLEIGGRRIPIAVDDAGAGVANFNHLVELRPDFVKLDIGLVRGVDHDVARQAVVAALLHFASSTDCRVIAEGVETEAERRTLIVLGVELAQGYLFGRPAPGAAWASAATSGRRARSRPVRAAISPSA